MGDTIEIVQGTATVVEVAGPSGPQGPIGATGAAGAAGQGVPPGGTIGQVLKKASNANYDTEWGTGGGGGSGTVTSVALAGTGLSISGSPITASGTITANVAYGTTAGTACEGNDGRIATIKSASINTTDAQDGGLGGTINTGGWENSNGGSLLMNAEGFGNGGSINTSDGGGSIDTHRNGGSINTSVGGGSIDTRGTGSIELGVAGTRTTVTGTATADRAIALPDAAGTLALTTTPPASHTHGNITNAGAVGSVANLPLITTTSGVVTTGAFGTGATDFAAGNHTHTASAISDSTTAGRALLTAADASAQRTSLGLGTFATANAATPPAIGSTTPAAGAFTTLSTTGALTSANGTASTPTALSTALGLQWSSLGGTDIAAVYGTYAGSGKVGIGVGTSGILTEVAAFSLGGITLNRAVTANNGTLTASAPVLDLAQTWNNAAVTFTGLQHTITNTASAVGSRLFNFVVGSTSALSARTMTGVIATEALAINGGDRGLVFGSNSVTNPNAAFFSLRWQNNVAGFNTSAILTWGADVYNLSYDLALQRDAADTFAQRRGSNAQTFNIYNTYTSSTNYERGFLKWDSNVFRIYNEAGSGGGTLRNVAIGTVTSFGGSGGLWINTAANQFSLGAATGHSVRVTSSSVELWSSSSLTVGVTSGRFYFGGTDSTFPALKRSSTALQVRLADDSAYSVIDAQLRAQGTAPATSGATGTAGDLRYDADYIYVCTATNTWKRAAIVTW